MFRMCFCAALSLVSLILVPQMASAQAVTYKSADTANALPEDFRGKISYFGNHSGELTTARTGEARKPTSDCPRPDQRCPVRIGGSLQVDLEFEGDVVRGSFRGSGGLRDSGLIGRRQGAQCRLFDLTDGSVWAGHCDREGFVGTVKSVGGAATQISLSFEVVGTKTNDYAEAERQRRLAQQTARRIEFLRSVIASDDPIDDRVLASIELDSYSWSYDRLRTNTLTITRRTKPRRGSYEIDADFELEGGSKGWAHARIDGDTIACIEFWDYPGKCRTIKLPTPPVDTGEKPDDNYQSSFQMPPPLTIPRGAYGV